jgi:hypothetical protein
MKELKRLSTGFISALMVLTMILMPIPQTNRAWADSDEEQLDNCIKNPTENDNGIYKPGCEMMREMSKASLERADQYHKEQFKSLIEQYIVGLFGLTLINGLNWKYLYKDNPAAYGMDCPANWGAKVTLPLSMAAALTYIIGDAQANVKFTQASKEATDNAFSAKAKNYIPDADSDEVKEAKEKGEQDPRIKAVLENKKQIEAYDTLISILESQYGAVKTKKNLARVASIGYYGAEAAELTNITLCTIECTQSLIQDGVDLTKITADLTTAITDSATCAATTCPPAPANPSFNAVSCSFCGTLSGLLGKESGAVAASKARNKALAIKKEAETTSKMGKVIASIGDFFSKVGSWFTNGKDVANQATSVFEKAKGASEKVAEQAKIMSEQAGLASTEATTSTTQISSLIANTETLEKSGSPLGMKAAISAKKYVATFTENKMRRSVCCGGAGVTQAIEGTFNKALETVNTTNAFAKAAVAQLNAKHKAKCSYNPAGGMYGCGTYMWQGVPTTPSMHKVNDIVIKSLFGGKDSAASILTDPNALEMLYARKEFSKLIIRSGLENMLLNMYTDEQMQNPKQYIKMVAVNSMKLDEIMDYYDKEVSDDIESLIGIQKLGYTEKMKKFVEKVANELFIPQAQAISGGMGMAVGGMLLQMVGSQVKNPWLKEIFNMGSKLVMLQGLLGKVAKEYALVSPLGRSLTWAIIATANEFVISFLKQTKTKIEKNIQIVKDEKQRYLDSAVARTGLSDNRVKGNGNVQLEKYDPTANLSNSMNIKACAVAKGNGFAPAMCPSVIPKQKVSLPELSKKMKAGMTPDHLKGLSLMSNYSYGAATGGLQGDSMSDSQMDELEQHARAMASHNATLRDKVDKNDAKAKGSDKFKGSALNKVLGSFKRSLGNGGAMSPGAPLASTGGEAYQRRGGKVTTNNVVNKGKKPTTSGGGGSVAAVKAPDFDLDFGDEDAGGVANADGTAADAAGTKGPEKLEDFVLKHDDINKRSEVPIWKILSNRYILSYPKILEEEDAKLEPEQVKDKKK